MKKGKSILTRCLALALALVLIASGANLGTALKVFAAEQTTVNASQLVVNNYELTEAEEKLILSGNLVDKTITYAPLSEGKNLVSVDTDNKKITASTYEGWNPVKAEIVVGTETMETVTLVDGVGTYKYAENAFAVKVSYEMVTEVNEQLQTNLLYAGAALKEGVANMNAANYGGNAAHLQTIVDSMSVLKQLADGVSIMGMSLKFQKQSTIDAVNALYAELNANGGKLKLQIHNEAYADATSKTQYLAENGAAYMEAVKSTYSNLLAINNPDDLINNELVVSMLEMDDETNGTQNAKLWKAVKSILNSTISALEAPATAPWHYVTDGQTLLAENVNFAELDVLVAAIEKTSSNSVVNPLLVATGSVQENLSMKNVNIVVVLNEVEPVADSTKLIETSRFETTIVLAEGTSKEVLAQEIAKVTDAIWEPDVLVNSVATATEIPASLTEDITYTLTYNPVEITIKLGYADDMVVPYGFMYTLPSHEDASLVYDYVINGEIDTIQGKVWAFGQDTEITRTEGPMYTFSDLYTEIGKNFGNETAQDILSSGALLGNDEVYVRMPNQAVAHTLLNFDGNTLTAVATADGWYPHSYGASGKVENSLGADYVGAWSDKTVAVKYYYMLPYDISTTTEVMALADALQTEANGQILALENLYAYMTDMGTLTSNMLAFLRTAIDITDFTDGDGDENDAYTVAMRKHFYSVLDKISAECLADNKDQNLKLYMLLRDYVDSSDDQKLKNFYVNSEKILPELNLLAKYLNEMLGDDELSTTAGKEAALVALCNNVQGYGHYADKITDLKDGINDVVTNLIAPNVYIDVTSENLGTLVEILAKGEKVEQVQESKIPYILSGELIAMDNSFVNVQVTVVVNGKTLNKTYMSETIGKNDVMSAANIDALVAEIKADVKTLLGDKYGYYSLNITNNPNDVKDKEMATSVYSTFTYTPNAYTVKIAGEADQTVTAEKLWYKLPEHENAPAMIYKYYLDGKEIAPGEYKFDLSDLAKFTNGSITFTRVALNEAESGMNDLLNTLNNNTSGNVYTTEKDAEGNTVKLIANVSGNQSGIMSFATDLALKGYSYIGLNGQPLVYTTVNADGTEIKEVSIQTLINALMADTSFGSQTLINLGNNNGGKLLTATMQLGQSSDKLYYEDLEFVLNLNGVPGQMATVAGGLNAIKNYMSFQSNGDHMFVNLNLPEAVYQVYLTAMWGIGELDKSDINAINNAVAFYFLYDYIDLIVNCDVTSQTFENTLKVFDDAANSVLGKDIPDYDLSAYDKYMSLVRNALNSDGVVIAADETTMSLSVTGQGKHVMTLVNVLGLDLSAYQMQIGMVKEFKEGNTLSAKVIASLANTSVHYEALAFGTGAGVGYTTNLAADLANGGKSVVMLLDDINGDLVVNGATIIDLNGKTINGNLVANGHTFIMDSTLDTWNAGGVTGSVSGNAYIIAGNYNVDVSSFLPDGYEQDGTTVKNVLYYIDSPNRGDMNFTINTDFYKEAEYEGYLPNVAALAGDITLDIALNYYLSSMLSIDGNNIFNIDFDDVIGVIASATTASDILNQLLCLFDAKGYSAAFNAISADLLDFAAIEKSLINGTEVFGYDLTVAPYGVEIAHVEDGDYLTFSLGSVESHAWTYHVGVKFEGDNRYKPAKVYGDLASIVVAEKTYVTIDLEQPYYGDRTLWLDGSFKTSMALDLSKNPAYQTVIAVFLAYGNPDKAEDLINAIGDQVELKRLFNDISVAEFFNALKAMQLNVNFTEMAASVGVTVDTSDVAIYENIIHLIAVSTGSVLDHLDITGWTDKTMGMLEEGDTGVYSLGFDADAYGDVTVRGFTLDVAAVIEHVIFSVKIFGDDCLWGDADHNGVVDQHDASLVLQYFLGNLDENEFFCTKRTDVDGNGVIDQHDASLILEYFLGFIDKFPAEA